MKKSKRIWLNSDPAFLASIGYDMHTRTVTIRDCRHTVSLEFGVYGPTTIAERKKKIRKLIEFLEEFEEHMLDIPDETDDII